MTKYGYYRGKSLEKHTKKELCEIIVELDNIREEERIRKLEEALAERDEMIIGLTSKKLINKK